MNDDQDLISAEEISDLCRALVSGERAAEALRHCWYVHPVFSAILMGKPCGSIRARSVELPTRDLMPELGPVEHRWFAAGMHESPFAAPLDDDRCGGDQEDP